MAANSEGVQPQVEVPLQEVKKDLNVVFNEVDMSSGAEGKRRSDSEASQRTSRSKPARREEEQSAGQGERHRAEMDAEEEGDKSRKQKKKKKKNTQHPHDPDERQDADGVRTPAKPKLEKAAAMDTGAGMETDMDDKQRITDLHARVNKLHDAGRNAEREIEYLKTQMKYAHDHIKQIEQEHSGRMLLFGGLAPNIPHFLKTKQVGELVQSMALEPRDVQDIKWNGRSRMVEVLLRNEYVAKMAMKWLRNNGMDKEALGAGTYTLLGQSTMERDRLRPFKVATSTLIDRLGYENAQLLKFWDDTCSVAEKSTGNVLLQCQVSKDNRYIIQVTDITYEALRNNFKEVWAETFKIEDEEMDPRSYSNFVWPVRFVPTKFTINAYDDDEPLGKVKGKGKGKHSSGKHSEGDGSIFAEQDASAGSGNKGSSSSSSKNGCQKGCSNKGGLCKGGYNKGGYDKSGYSKGTGNGIGKGLGEALAGRFREAESFSNYDPKPPWQLQTPAPWHRWDSWG